VQQENPTARLRCVDLERTIPCLAGFTGVDDAVLVVTIELFAARVADRRVHVLIHLRRQPKLQLAIRGKRNSTGVVAGTELVFRIVGMPDSEVRQLACIETANQPDGRENRDTERNDLQQGPH
jgi:hypothetical protein